MDFIIPQTFVKFLAGHELEVIVSAYPEPHPDSEGFDFDLKLLKEKTLAGSNQCITQFCFSTERLRKASYPNFISEKLTTKLLLGLCLSIILIVFVIWPKDAE